MLRYIAAIGLMVSAVAILFYVALFIRAPQLPWVRDIFPPYEGRPAHSPEEAERDRRRILEYRDALRRAALQQERRRDIGGMAVFGSLATVCVITLRRGRKSAS